MTRLETFIVGFLIGVALVAALVPAKTATTGDQVEVPTVVCERSRQLLDRYTSDGYVPRWFGETKEGAVLIFTDQYGRWRLVESFNDGMACERESGTVQGGFVRKR